jgi:hypothetical protein
MKFSHSIATVSYRFATWSSTPWVVGARGIAETSEIDSCMRQLFHVSEQVRVVERRTRLHQ